VTGSKKHYEIMINRRNSNTTASFSLIIGTPYLDKELSSLPNLELKVSRTLGRTLESSFPEELVWFSSLAKHHNKKAFVVPRTS